jgi:hypothetical protein
VGLGRLAHRVVARALDVAEEALEPEAPEAVAADLAAFTKVWLGDISFDQALRSHGVRLEGPRDVVRAFPGWLLLGSFAGVARPRPARASRGRRPAPAAVHGGNAV